MEWLALVLGVLAAGLGLLYGREAKKRASSEGLLKVTDAELKAARNTAADLRIVMASKEKVIRDMELQLAEVDPSGLFDGVFGRLSDED